MSSNSPPNVSKANADAAPFQVHRMSTRARDVGINRDHWYPVAWTRDLRRGEVKTATLWESPIAIFRAMDGTLGALEDACLHKGVELSKGAVVNDRLVCAYHGWEFTGDGKCARIPYLDNSANCPRRRLQHFPVQERYGIVWLFPGDASLAESVSIPGVPEFDDPSWCCIEIPAEFDAHFSICNENTLDVFNGHLHRDVQGWVDPVLRGLQRAGKRVEAAYSVSCQNRRANFLSLARPRKTHEARAVDICYDYPHCRSQVQQRSSLYLMRLPVDPTKTRTFSLMFLKLAVPKWLGPWVRRQVGRALWHLALKRSLAQDREMVESEQRADSNESAEVTTKVNPVAVALQQIIVDQFDQGRQPSDSGPSRLPLNNATPSDSLPVAFDAPPVARSAGP